MYKNDVNIIKNHGLNNADGLVDVIRFTLCTIQQSLSGCDNQIKDIEKNGLKSKSLWGLKSKGLEYSINNKDYLLKEVKLLTDNPNDIDTITKGVELFMAIPNIGLVKAGFIMQMLGFNIACMDMHNIKRLGLKSNVVNIPATLKRTTKIKKIKAYIQLTQKKGTEYWWDSWCDYVAGNRGNKELDTGTKVSEYHIKCVIRK
jgi:hypothetical protein